MIVEVMAIVPVVAVVEVVTLVEVVSVGNGGQSSSVCNDEKICGG